MSGENGSLQLPEGTDCAFCDYLSGRRPYTVLLNDGTVAILVTREQRGIDHLLVLPVRHVETLLGLEDNEAAAVMRGVRDAARAIDAAAQRPGIAVWQNNGVPAHQLIPHVHFHVAGTLEDGGTDFGAVPELTVAETNAIGEAVAPFLLAARNSNSEF